MLKHVFAATEFEMADAIKAFDFKPEIEAPFKCYVNGSVRLVISGIGLVNAALAYAWAAGNFKFENSANIGAAGHVRGPLGMGSVCRVSSVACLEPYDNEVFDISAEGVRLVSSARPVVSALARSRAAMLGDIVDMEGYSIAFAARMYSKHLEIVKFVSDFSPDCDIHANIGRLRYLVAKMESFWAG